MSIQAPAAGTAAEILANLADVGITLRLDGEILRAAGPLDDELRQLLRTHKPELLAYLKAEKARAKVLSDLRACPAIRYAAEIGASGDPVRIMLAVRDVGSCVLEIDAQRWDLERFITMMDQRVGLGLEVAA